MIKFLNKPFECAKGLRVQIVSLGLLLLTVVGANDRENLRD